METNWLAFGFSHSDDEPWWAGEIRGAFAHVVDSGDGTAIVHRPRNVAFPFSPIEGWQSEQFSTSRTRGLFGGIADERRRGYSDASERALSDVLTSAVCEIVDRRAPDRPDQVVIVIMGLALPKLVGRLLSLRLSESIAVIWLEVPGATRWITGADPGDAGSGRAAALSPSALWGEDEWQDERFIVGEKFPRDGESRISHSCVAQYLRTGERQELIDVAEPLGVRWVRSAPVGLHGPRGLIAAAEQVGFHDERPYRGVTGEQLRTGGDELAFYAPAGTYEMGIDGWPVKWV